MTPAVDAAWVTAKKNSQLRIVYNPQLSGVRSSEAVVIWTLLDMLEAQRGWEKE